MDNENLLINREELNELSVEELVDLKVELNDILQEIENLIDECDEMLEEE